MGLFLVVAAIVLIVIFRSFFTVETAQAAVVTRFGKFLRVAEAGLNWKRPLVDSVARRISLRVAQINLTMETKTKDNVFVTIPISVQNRVRPDDERREEQQTQEGDEEDGTEADQHGACLSSYTGFCQTPKIDLPTE